MNSRICIIGSGPTGIFALTRLSKSNNPLSITIFEAERQPGKGTPYLPGVNDPVMLSNIPSIEIPPLAETLVGWLHRQTDDYLSSFGIARSLINERDFYPRLVLGDYFQDQFDIVVSAAHVRGHQVTVHAGHRVVDIELDVDHIRLRVKGEDEFCAIFDHVVMATGHNWPENIEIHPGYFSSPWPAATLKKAGCGRLGVLGTSLSGIDALMTVATRCGSFVHDDGGVLQFVPAVGCEKFSAVMMSRKGLLPEADFYGPLPYRGPHICTRDAVEAEIAIGSTGLLDRIFELFRKEIIAADPDYAAEIGLSQLDVDTFANAYYGRRQDADPFAWAALNLAEAEHNIDREITTPWRYAILITHEIIAKAVPHLDTEDLQRFNRSFKSIFIDEYATVPHLSIKRLLALYAAGRLQIMKLGETYNISTEGLDRGTRVHADAGDEVFDSFIDATGQSSLSARDLPFPSLLRQKTIQAAATAEPHSLFANEGETQTRRTGGIDIDEYYRPLNTGLLSNRLYCVAIPFLLHKHPFVQGITSAAELGETAANAILEDLQERTSPILLTA